MRTTRVVTVAVTAVAMTGAALLGATSASADTVDYGPDRVIRPVPGFNSAAGLAARSDGTVYLADFRPGADAVWIFGPSADGVQRRTRTIAGAKAALGEVADVGVDAAGLVYVLSEDDRVSVFRRGAYGDVAPIRTFDTGEFSSHLAVSRDGKVAVAHDALGEVAVYAAGASAGATPAQLITGPRTGLGEGVTELAFTSTGALWVDADDVLRAFAAGATGDTPPLRSLTPVTGATGGVSDVAVDAKNRLYVAQSYDGLGGSGTVVSVFPADARGEMRPIRSLEGSRSRLSTIQAGAQIAVDGRGELAVTGYPRKDVLVFRTLFPGRPSVVRSVRVSGKASAKKRTVRWKKPADDGGRDVRSYKVVFRKGSKVLKRVTLKPGRRSYTVRKSALRRGKLTVTVRAKTAKGWSPKAVKKFRVR
ncbi:hypothetical protein [Mumia sp. zg.B21]|uniref:hypothetical protein n=1 Tax=Mumia sp. zg.B21 TaxID=2855447 RepID=UPI0021042A16|nr:hypothetical protein [Mumia sp. zg.B21]